MRSTLILTNFYDRALRRWFPKRYVRMMMTRETVQHRQKVRAAKSREERRELEVHHNWDMRDLEDWLTSIEDKELITRAARMDLSLDDIPTPASDDPNETRQHWQDSECGSRVLCRDSRRALQKAIRERAPAYRRERREVYEFYLKIVLGVGGVMTGIGGTLIGILSVLKKMTLPIFQNGAYATPGCQHRWLAEASRLC